MSPPNGASRGGREDALTVGDLISVRALRTVVQLADLTDAPLRDSLVEDFVVTSDVKRSMDVVVDALRRPSGSGFFLQGSFGSGKSHFLVVLARLLGDARAADRICAEVGCAPPEGASIVVPISLVAHRAESRLEDAVSRAVAMRLRDDLGVQLWPSPPPEMLGEIRARIAKNYGRELAEFLGSPDGEGVDEQSFFTTPASLALFIDRYRLPYRLRFERGEFFDEVSTALGSDRSGPRLVLLIDELSEFLRSKADARSFNEDVRFLQFLGEAGERMPLWIVASLQEWIEETGEIRQETFNKIKDRYPARLTLSGAHLGELVRRRLAPKKPSAAERLDRLHRELCGAVPGFDVGREEFRDLYPVHPATLQVLDDLRSLFSQHRGAVDFLNARIAGDARRGVRGILSEPMSKLVTADEILEHFEDRIRETVEYQPYLDVVHRYWRQEIGRILQDPGDRALGMRALAILILAAIAPVARRYALKRLSAMLLPRVTSIDPLANAEHLRDILLRMTREGAYLEHSPSESDSLLDVFTVRLEADVNLLISKKLKAAQKDVLAEGPSALRRLSTLLTDPVLPLGSWRDLEPAEVEVRWQNTRRRGLFLFGDPLEFGRERFLELFRSLAAGEPDFLFMVVSPWSPPDVKAWIADRIAPLVDDATGLAVRFWIPGSADDLSSLATVLARALLLSRLQTDQGPMAPAMAERLRAQLESDGGKVREFVRDLYVRGVIVSARGVDVVLPRHFGLQEFGEFVERVAARELAARFPAHESVAPRTDAPVFPRLDALLDGFFRAGTLPKTAAGVDKLIVEGYLLPLGLARKSKDGLVLHADPRRSPPLRDLLDSLGDGPEPLEELSRSFRKGPYGMAAESFQLLVLAGAYSGQLRLWGQKSLVGLEELRASHVSRIRAVSRGEVVGDQEQAELRSLFFLDEKLRSREPFSNPLQESLWGEVKEFRRKTEAELAELEALFSPKGEFPAVREAGFDAGGLRDRALRVAHVLREIKVSYGSREGLENFLRALRAEPYFQENYFELQDALGFLQGPVDGFLRASAYAAEAEGVIADAPEEWEPARRALEDLTTALAAGPPHRPGSRSRREAALEAFLGVYVPLYRAEHDRERSPARFRSYRALLESRSFRVLKALSRVERLSAGNELVTLHRRIDAVLRRECASLSVDALRVKPLCECGYRPSARLSDDVAPSTASILRDAESALRRVLEELGAPENRERVEAHVEALRSIGDATTARGVREILAIATRELGGDDVEVLDGLLTQQVTRALRDALGGRVLSVDRSVADLVDRISGRVFSRSKLLSAVEDWVRGDEEPDADVLIRVVDGSAVPGRLAAVTEDAGTPALDAYLGERRPELAGLLASGALRPELLPMALWARELEIAGDCFSQLPGIDAPPEGEWDRLAALASELRDEDPAAFAECVRVAEGVLLAADDWAGIARRCGLSLAKGDLRRLIEASSVFPGFQSSVAEELAHSVARGDPIPRWVDSVLPDGFPAAAPLRELVAFERARRRLAAGALPEEPRGFEDMLRADLGDLVYRAALLDGLCQERGVDLARKQIGLLYREALERWTECFSGIISAGEQPDVLRIENLVAEWAARAIASFKPAETLWVLLDGMRWDVWHYLRDHFLPALPGRYRVVDETVSWARVPTTTETQIRRLENPYSRGEIVATGRLVSREDYLRRRSAGGAAAALGLIVKLDFIDHKVHTFRESMYEFYRETRIGAEIHLQGLLEALPERSLAILFADHGFRENPAFDPSQRYETTRYAHGGDHFLEVLAPAAMVLKISER